MEITIRMKMPVSGPSLAESGSRNSITITSSKGSRGRARNRSVRRISGLSRRRKKPADMPIKVPNMTEIDMAVMPTAIETLPPAIKRAIRSRPNSSVPKGNCPLGGLLRISRLA